MTIDLSSEETTVVAIYTNRHDAEVAGDFLEGQGIDASVAADDVHPPLQMTEGARLMVMRREAERAYGALNDAGLLSTADEQSSDLTAGHPTQSIAWVMIVVFALVIVAMIGGLILI